MKKNLERLQDKKILKYSAQGLIEAVMAIAIVGIACLVFLDIATDSVVTVDNIVKSDQLVKVSTETGQKVRKIAELQNNNKDLNVTLFPNPVNSVGQCFEVSGDFQQPAFTNSARSVCTVNTLDTCRSNVTTSDNVFSVYCITQSPQGNLVIGSVYTGLKECKKSDDGKCIIPDSKYTVAVYIDTSTRAICNFNNVCEASRGENAGNCLDCSSGGGSTCNNGICEINETALSCPADCRQALTCNYNDICEAARGESALYCSDCKPKSSCGNGICEFKYDETAASCIADCHCGNGVCESQYSEDALTCNADCYVAPPPQNCQSVCVVYNMDTNVCESPQQICTPPSQCIKICYKRRNVCAFMTQCF
jgi:hypothetical protein